MILVLFLVGGLLRCSGVGNSLQQDEFGTLWAITASVPGDVVENALSFHGQSPFYYVVLWFTQGVLPEREWSLRAPSLLAGGALCVVLLVAGRRHGSPSMACFAAALALLLPYTVRYSAQARPYAFAALFAAVMIFGFLEASRGSSRGRVSFVVGGVGLFYSHYMLTTIAFGIPIAYAFSRSLRERYPVRRFVADVAVQIVCAIPGGHHVLSLIERRESLEHLAGANLLFPLRMLAPTAGLAAVSYVSGAWKRHRPIAPATELTLWACLVAGLAPFYALTVLGSRTLTDRYLFALNVPAILLGAAGLSALRNKPVRVVVCTAWIVLMGAYYASTFERNGTLNTTKRTGWREVSEVLQRERAGDARTAEPILLLPGFVEQELLPLGYDSTCLSAPLRSPGKASPAAPVLPICRWDPRSPARRLFFDSRVAPMVDAARSVLVVGPFKDLMSVKDYVVSLKGWKDCGETYLHRRDDKVVLRLVRAGE